MAATRLAHDAAPAMMALGLALLAGGDGFRVTARVGRGSPLTLAEPVDVALTFSNPTADALDLHLEQRIPVLLRFEGERPRASVTCGLPKLVGPRPAGRVEPGKTASFTVRCERFDLAPLPKRLPPGHWRLHGSALAAPPEVPLSMEPTSFEVRGDSSPPAASLPAKRSIGGVEASVERQVSSRSIIYNGAVGEDGTGSVSRHESFGVLLRLRATVRGASFSMVDLFARPVASTASPPQRGCGATLPDATPAGEPFPLWTGAIVDVHGQAFAGRLEPKQTVDLWLNVIHGDSTQALQATPHTYVVRLIDAKERTHWIESAALAFCEEVQSAP